jgi:hypothetical protein
MSDVLGAPIGSDDPEEIAKVRASVPKILAIGAHPTATPKQAPRSGAVYDDRGYLEGRDPRPCRRLSLRRWGTSRCRRYGRSAPVASIVVPARRKRSPNAIDSGSSLCFCQPQPRVSTSVLRSCSRQWKVGFGAGSDAII